MGKSGGVELLRGRAWILFASLACCDADDRTTLRGGDLPVQSVPDIAAVPAPLPEAHCTVQVDGIGEISMEEDYLPHVITCENGGANLEALKAQAIAARSVVYYSIETSGSICDSQGCQVYSCGADPSPMAYQAVQETSGVYLMYNDTLTYGFYVAGDPDTPPPGCLGNDGNATTEHWVTYNEGKSGDAVTQTELGFVHAPGDAGYGQNRGCMGQWGARCLENDNGYDYVGILRFYYGDDIVLEQAQGECVTPMGGTTGGGESGDAGDTVADSGPLTDEGAATDGGSVSVTDDGGVSITSDATVTAEGGVESEDGAGTAFDEGGAEDRALPATYGESDGAAGGCACRSTSHDATAWPWWCVLALLAPRRRSRTA